MYELNTKQNDNSVIAFIEQVESPRKGKTPINYWIFLRKPPNMKQKCRAEYDRIRFLSLQVCMRPRRIFAPKSKNKPILSACDPPRESLLNELGKHTTEKIMRLY